MRSKSAFNTITLPVLALFLFVFSACGGGSAVKSEPAASPDSTAAPAAADAKETPLAKKYDRIVFQQFEYDQKIEADYPGAVAECERSTLEAVIAKKIFAAAVRETTGAKQAGALLAKIRITNLRIVSTGARMWGGAFAGSSEMSLQMKLIDAASGAVVREKELSTNNNPWAASWTGGSTDRSLPTDLGKMVAEYLGSIQPQNDKMAVPAPMTAEKKSADSNAPEPAAAVKEAAKPTQIVSENIPSTSQPTKTLVVTRTASVRAGPNTKSKILGTLKKGTKVESLGKSGTWFKIKLPTGATGWVAGSLVTEQK